MIERETKYVSEYQLRAYILEHFGKDVRDMSGVELLEGMFGTFRERGDFRIENRYYQPKETWVHRLNRLWAFPLTLICSPYMYIKHGQIGWSDKTRFGSWLLKVTGYA
ncbi:hypothetical protein [Photobacterium sp. GSS17]|uniref:hypothetical protein n=1 Tax=Photobacterium sp. GSS17 TaxID=3020715 RepID=UPI002361F7BE|nr:hypothetical protein [Photobacterium sp. GSS17]